MVKRILVGIDFSEASKKALATARGWAGRLGVPIVAMHVLQSPAPLLPEAESMNAMSQGWMDSVFAHAVEQMERWVKDVPGASVVVKWGGPAECLVAEADPETLLIVGNVGHSAFERMLFGSTAVKVVKHAPCDVLVVRNV